MINNNNISDDQDDDLKGAPHLSKRAANNPFKSDDDYFESFVSSLQGHIDDFEEIKKDAPILSAIPKYNPFVTPAGYFDELPTFIRQRVINAKSSTSFTEWILLLIKPRFAIPVLATILIAFSGINFMTKHAESQKAEILNEDTSVEEQLYGIDESIIVETLDPVASIENESTSTDDDNIENYLIDNNVDETELTQI